MWGAEPSRCCRIVNDAPIQLPGRWKLLALASAARHPGIALAILAANLPDHKSALAAILLSLVVSMIVPIPYLRWIKPRMAI